MHNSTGRAANKRKIHLEEPFLHNPLKGSKIMLHNPLSTMHKIMDSNFVAPFVHEGEKSAQRL